MRVSMRGVAVVAATAAALVLAGCSSDASADPAAEADEELIAMLPEDVRDSGRLVIGITSTYPPMEYIDLETDELVGFDVDIITEIAARLGLEPEMDVMPKYDQIINSVATGRVDVSITAMSDTPERRGKLDFIDYVLSGTTVYTTEGSDIEGFEDLCGRTVALAQSTTYPDHVMALSERVCGAADAIEIIGLDTTATAKLQLDQERADAAVASPESYAHMAAGEPGTLRIVGEVIEPTLYGIGFGKDRSELRDAVFAALETMFEDGTYDEIIADWGLATGALDAPTLNEGEQ